MSWISNGATALHLNGDAADTLAQLLFKLKELQELRGKSLAEAVSRLLDEGPDPNATSLLKLFKLKLEEGEKEDIARLFSSLGDLERQDEETNRRIGAFAKDWTQAEITANSHLLLDLSAAGTFDFVVDKDAEDRDEGLPDLGQKKASAELRMSGKAGIKARGTTGDLGLNLSASAARRISYYLSYGNLTTVSGLALAGGIRRLGAPVYDWRAVTHSFRSGGPGDLDAIRMSGKTALGGDANFGVSIAAAQGTVAIAFKGSIQTAREFQTTITSPSPALLRAAIDVSNPLSHSTEFGLGYTLGLSALAPGAARKLLAKTAKAGDFIDQFDAFLANADNQSWLKPGTVLATEITDAVEDYVQGAGSNLARKGLARLFGLDHGKDFDAEVITQVVDATSKLLRDALDDALGIVQGDTQALEQWFDHAIEKHVDSRVRQALQARVLEQLPALDRKLREQAERLDDAAKEALEIALGRSIEDPVSDLRSAIETSRSLLTKINEGIAASMDELLAIEFGFASERSKQADGDFVVSFSEAGQDEYARAILSPSRFGRFLLTHPDADGVDIESALHRTLLAKSASTSFGLSLATIELRGGTTLSSDVEIVHTDSGVAAVSRAELKKFVKFLLEEREASFLSANTVLRARQVETAAPLSGSANDLPEAAPDAAPKLALRFRETDGKLSLKEVRKLTARLLAFDLLSEDAHADVVKAFREESDGRRIAASFAISLAIPPLSVPTLIRYGAENRDALRAVMRPLIAEHLDWEIKRAISGLRISNVGDANTPEEIMYLLTHIDEIYDAADLRFSSPGNRPRRPDRNRRYTKAEMMEGLIDVRNALDVLHNVFRIGAEILDMDIAPGDSEQLENKQRQMVAYVKPFLRPGIPLPGWFPVGGKMPVRTVLLFLALQRVAGEALEATPPLVLQLKPNGKAARTFISPVAAQ